MAGSHYDLLGVSHEASGEEIRRAYRLLARRIHPDAQPRGDSTGVADAQRKMASLSAAYAVLSDPDKRQAYDRTIGFSPGPATATRPAPSTWQPLDGDLDVDLDGDLDGDLDEAGWRTGSGERFDRLGDDGDVVPGGRRPEDFLMMIPPALVVLAVSVFAVGVVFRSHTMWAMAIVLTPVAFVSFAAAPLVSMLRSRRR